MKELIFLGVGGAGTRITDKTWQHLSHEHGLAGKPSSVPSLYNHHAISSELPDGRYRPRVLFADLSPQVVDEVRKGTRKDLYSSSSFVTGKEDSSNNYIRGRYTLGRQIGELVQQRLLRLLEGCDNLNGLVISCSMSGGTGSGLTNLILDSSRYNNMLNKKTILVNMLMPSPQMSDTIVEPYNFVMGLGDFINLDCQKCVVGFDNQQIYRLCEQQGIDEPSYNEVNGMIGKALSVMLHPFRKNNSDSMAEIVTNLIPYTKNFLLSPSLVTTNDVSKIPTAVPSLYTPISCLNSYRCLQRETIVSTYASLRGDISHFESLNMLNTAKRQMNFCDWNLTNLKLSCSTYLPCKQTWGDSLVQGVMLVNSDSCRWLLDRQHRKYDRLWEKRSFVHWYVGEGIDDDAVTYGRAETASLEKDYQEIAIGDQYGAQE